MLTFTHDLRELLRDDTIPLWFTQWNTTYVDGVIGRQVNARYPQLIQDSPYNRLLRSGPFSVDGTNTHWDAPGFQDMAELLTQEIMTFAVVDQPAVPPLLDAVSTGANAAYSFRKLRAAWGGSAIRLRASGDDNETDIGFDANGDFDVAAAAAHLTLHGGTGFVVRFYDQTENGDDILMSVSFPAKQPSYSATGMNGLPTAVFDGGDALSTDDTYAIGGTDMSVFGVMHLIGGDDAHIVSYNSPDFSVADFSNASSAVLFGWFAGLDRTVGYHQSVERGNFQIPTRYGGFVMASIWDGANHIIYFDDIVGDSAAAVTSFGATGRICVGAQAETGTSFLTGRISEIILSPTAVGSTARTAIYENQRNYWAYVGPE